MNETHIGLGDYLTGTVIHHDGYNGNSVSSQSVSDISLSDRVAALIAEADAEKLDEQAKLLAAEISSRLGNDDDYVTGSMIYFERNFYNEADKFYSYTALKAGGMWFITGRSRHGYRISWADLVRDFLVPAFVETDEVYVVTSMDKV